MKSSAYYAAALLGHVIACFRGKSEGSAKAYALIMELDGINSDIKGAAEKRQDNVSRWKRATLNYATKTAPKFGLNIVSGTERAQPTGDA